MGSTHAQGPRTGIPRLVRGSPRLGRCTSAQRRNVTGGRRSPRTEPRAGHRPCRPSLTQSRDARPYWAIAPGLSLCTEPRTGIPRPVRGSCVQLPGAQGVQFRTIVAPHESFTSECFLYLPTARRLQAGGVSRLNALGARLRGATRCWGAWRSAGKPGVFACALGACFPKASRAFEPRIGSSGPVRGSLVSGTRQKCPSSVPTLYFRRG